MILKKHFRRKDRGSVGTVKYPPIFQQNKNSVKSNLRQERWESDKDLLESEEFSIAQQF